ncbi:hypothetical protein PO909_003853 [Leuciscus waleckii]
MEQILGRASAPPGPVLQVCFPSARAAVLENLNRQREEGQLCDLSIQVQGHVFRAHRCVLAASSPYFHDQVSVCGTDVITHTCKPSHLHINPLRSELFSDPGGVLTCSDICVFFCYL